MEGIIKSVTIDPAKLVRGGENATNVLVKIYFDAAALAALYTNAGGDPELVTTSYIVYDEDGLADLEHINLAEAVETGHEVSSFAEVGAAYINIGGGE